MHVIQKFTNMLRDLYIYTKIEYIFISINLLTCGLKAGVLSQKVISCPWAPLTYTQNTDTDNSGEQTHKQNTYIMLMQ